MRRFFGFVLILWSLFAGLFAEPSAGRETAGFFTEPEMHCETARFFAEPEMHRETAGFSSDCQGEASCWSADFLEKAKLNHRKYVFSADAVTKYFAPETGFSGSGSVSGTVGEESLYGSGNGQLYFSQRFPGFTGFSIYGNGSWYYSAEYFGDKPENSYSFSPGLKLTVPLIFSRETVRFLDKYGSTYSSSLKRYGDLSYKVSLSEARKNFVETAGTLIYLRELLAAYENREKLIHRQLADYEQLLVLGKITYLQLEEKASDYSQFLKEKRNAESELTACEGKLLELGLTADRIGGRLEEFVAVWEKRLEDERSRMGQSFFSDEMELTARDIQAFSDTDDIISSLPEFSASVSFSSSTVSEGFPDFSEAGWTVNFSVDVPIFGGSSISAAKRIKNYGKTAAVEKRLLQKKQTVAKKQRELTLKTTVSLCESLEKALKLEENRCEMLESLLDAGKVSQFDVDFQKNSTELSRLEYLSGRLNYVVLLADFY